MSNQKSVVGPFARKWYATAAGPPWPSMNKDGPAGTARSGVPAARLTAES